VISADECVKIVEDAIKEERQFFKDHPFVMVRPTFGSVWAALISFLCFLPSAFSLSDGTKESVEARDAQPDHLSKGRSEADPRSRPQPTRQGQLYSDPDDL
jgi:hypothetical protein